MMQQNPIEWAWFAFYTIGSVGGWVLLIGHLVRHTGKR